MKAFIEETGNILNIPRRDLIEKDMILHRLLTSLSQNRSFRNSFLFKGGTCLIKSYLGYYRFSEDMDFTWNNQSIFKGMSQKQIRLHLSGIIDNIGQIFESMSEDFVCDNGSLKSLSLRLLARLSHAQSASQPRHCLICSKILLKDMKFDSQITSNINGINYHHNGNIYK